MSSNVDEVITRLRRMQARGIWPNGPRYLWTDAWGVALYVSLFDATGDAAWLDAAEELAGEVERVLGRPRGLCIGEAPDLQGQHYHYLTLWMYALARLGEERAGHRERALQLAREIHPLFVVPGIGVLWKMREDLTATYPGTGLGALDPFHGFVVYRLLGEAELEAELTQLRALVEHCFPTLRLEQDLGLGMTLWLSHFFPQEPWARVLRARALSTLERMWIRPPGYFCRTPKAPEERLAFANQGISVGLQAIGVWPQRVAALRRYFDGYRSHDRYDLDAITHVMACAARLPGRMLAHPVYEQEAR